MNYTFILLFFLKKIKAFACRTGYSNNKATAIVPIPALTPITGEIL